MSEQMVRLTLKPSQAASVISKSLKANRVPMLHSSPGIGKSDIVHSVAEKYNLKVIDLRLSQCEPQDLLGFPYTDTARNKAGYIPMETFPIKGDPLPLREDGTPYKGWLLFLDELTSAPPEVQGSAYKLILDRMVGVHKVHEKVAMVGAGNLESDNAVVHPMSTALQSRLVHLELRLDMLEWINWAIDHKIDHRITDFIQFKPTNLHTFSPDHTDKTYACPRTWKFTDDVLKACDNNVDDPDFLYLASGCVGEGVAREFTIFCKIYMSLPKISDILIAPDTITMPNDPSILYALSGSVAAHVKEDTLDKLMNFINRMPAEFQVITLRYIMKRNPSFRTNPAILNWLQTKGSQFV